MSKAGRRGTIHAMLSALRLPRAGQRRAIRQALVLFVIARLLLTGWAITILAISPIPDEADELLRPYAGEPPLSDGSAGLLLGPWQRFDTMRYLSLARNGYDQLNSVFPPFYPLAIRGLGGLLRLVSGLPVGASNLVAALLIGNSAAIAALALLYELTTAELGPRAAARAPAYLLFFPTGFFLLAAYTESLFLSFALGAIWSARRGRPLLAGGLGLLAVMTRLTGWGLVMPLAYEYARRREFKWRRLDWRVAAALLPGLGLLLFLIWRRVAGLPPMADVYRQSWYQVTAFPGADLWPALKAIFMGAGPRAGEFTLLFDLLSLGLLAGTTPAVFRRLGGMYGLYNVTMLLFMLLPSSDLKPLYSFSRYALAFFPTFMVLSAAGRNPWVNRLVLYPSVALYLYFSGQFFLWGWVA